jgi:3-oxoacyl-[acyl-carrier protein] reductase
MLRGAMNTEMRNGMIARTPLGRLGAPADVADAVAFLAGDDARWITGQVIATAGGLKA